MLPSTVAALAVHKNIVGIKEATADMEQISEVIRLSGEGFSVLSGDDATTLPLLAIGGVGVISVTANVVPGDMSKLCSLYSEGKIAEARELHYKLLPLSGAMFVDTNPVPVKTALALMGIIGEELRLPLVGLSDENRGKLEGAMRDYGLIK
jgi:4-hydroxy-tetrahydrodipicolinate synthase